MNWLVLDFQSKLHMYIYITYKNTYSYKQLHTYVRYQSKMTITLFKKMPFQKIWKFLKIFFDFDNFSVNRNMTKHDKKLVQTGPKTGPIISVRNFSLINGRKHEKSWNFLSHDIVTGVVVRFVDFFQFSDQENFFSLSKVKFISDAQFNQARTSRV